ncbi:ABC transporter ATP-binding protein [Salinilacihabitans rarus]|uniref:ABC transporter ATP-binding protein n=1 Tax=Salinilacihabitans rarus TaxID=2961596 RepID=UPI0020C860BD|nr:ABC transporter ATP-binding protein [Salinilacihabitans rarus]
MSGDELLVRVEELKKYFWEQDSLLDRLLGAEPTAVRAVDGVSFEVYSGETLGLVGESGCGKSTTGETLLRLLSPTDGRVEFRGRDVYGLAGEALETFRREAAIVFQDPFSSLDPRMTIGQIVKQPLDVHDVGTEADRLERVEELLERVGLSADQFDRYPHEFSGGQRQRIAIARALALEPEFVVLDEPTSALDVSVQAQILNLLADLQEEFGLTYLLISHDLSVVRHVCDRVAVMYLGELVEVGPAAEFFADPKHPYSRALLQSVPRASIEEREREVDPLAGDVPSPRNPPSGCRFRTRCPVIIPPEEMAIDQQAFRLVTDVRQRIADRELSVEEIWADLGVDDPDGDVRARRADEFAAATRQRIAGDALPPAHEARVEDALTALATGDWTRAADDLRERYESVCERDHPALGDTEHPVACHHYDDRGRGSVPDVGAASEEGVAD